MRSVFDIARTSSIKNSGFIELLTQFLLEFGRPVPDREALGRMEEAVRTDRVRFYVALEEGRVVGVVSLTFSFSLTLMCPWALLSHLYVHPTHRGRGAAARLLLGAMDAAHEARCGSISTDLAGPLEGLFSKYGWQQPLEGGLTGCLIDLDGPPPSLKLDGEITFD